MKPTLWLAFAAALFGRPAHANDDDASTPYAQVRTAIDEMTEMIDDQARIIKKRKGRSRGPSVECMEEHHAAIEALLQLAETQRSELVEAMAANNTRAVNNAHRSVMLWRFKAGGHDDSFAACPSQQEYEFQKDLEKIDAPLEK